MTTGRARKPLAGKTKKIKRLSSARKSRLSTLNYPEVKAGDAGKLDSADKRQVALEMRIEGNSEHAIALTLGVSVPRVSQMLKEVLTIKTEINNMLGEELRTMELERIDRMIFAWYKRAKRDPLASTTLNKWIERRHKILPGMEITRSEISGQGGGPIKLTSSHIDITKLSMKQLEWLEEILAVAGPEQNVPEEDMKLITQKQKEEIEDED